MKIFGYIVLGFIAFIGLIVGVVMFASSGARDHARGFVEDISGGNYAAAHERLHPQLRQQMSEDDLAAMFAGAEPYAEVSFNSISIENGISQLAGTATTASDCTSAVNFELIGGDITMFDITPLCPAP